MLTLGMRTLLHRCVATLLAIAAAGMLAGQFIDAERRAQAEQGNMGAQFLLGVAYAKGLGVRQDYAEAAKWFRKSANPGWAGGQYALGNLYYEGQGVSQDYEEAYRWWAKRLGPRNT